MDLIKKIIINQMQSTLRYRCLLFQSGDISVFLTIIDAALEAIEMLGKSSKIINANVMLDEVGAYSCQKVLKEIGSVSCEQIIILSGPLHFLDYWSEKECAAFWDHLASLENSPGLIIIDVIRTSMTQGTFTEIGKITNTDIRYLKSRRAVLEAREA